MRGFLLVLTYRGDCEADPGVDHGVRRERVEHRRRVELNVVEGRRPEEIRAWLQGAHDLALKRKIDS